MIAIPYSGQLVTGGDSSKMERINPSADHWSQDYKMLLRRWTSSFYFNFLNWMYSMCSCLSNGCACNDRSKDECDRYSGFGTKTFRLRRMKKDVNLPAQRITCRLEFIFVLKLADLWVWHISGGWLGGDDGRCL